jgi:hypothetical protein
MDCSTCGAMVSDDAQCCPHCGTVMVTARDELAVGLSDPAWLEKRRDERVVGRTTLARPPLASGGSEIGEDGSIRVMVSGPVRHGERGRVDVVRILIARLNHDGAQWIDPECPDRPAQEEGGVDCEAKDDQGNKLQIQITRSDSDRAFYRRQAREGQADKLYANLDILTDTWRERIEDKATLAGRSNVILVLDAAESSPLPDAITLFRQRHGPWASQQGFKAIWIVGASGEWTYRLDATEHARGEEIC